MPCDFWSLQKWHFLRSKFPAILPLLRKNNQGVGVIDIEDAFLEGEKEQDVGLIEQVKDDVEVGLIISEKAYLCEVSELEKLFEGE